MTKAILLRCRPVFSLVLGLAVLPACSATMPPPAPLPPPVAPGSPPVAAATILPAPTAAAAAATSAEAPPPVHRKHHPGGGMVVMFMDGLDLLGLKPEQKAAIERIESDLDKLGDALKEPRARLEQDIADGVVAGKFDHTKTDADITALSSAVAAIEPSVQDALNRLHKVLDPEQRKKLVATMREKTKTLAEHSASGAPEHGTSVVVEHDAQGPDAHKHGGPSMSDGSLSSLGYVFALTREQTERLPSSPEAQVKAEQAAMKTKREAAEKHVAAVVAAFEGDPFDAKKAGVGAQAADTVKATAAQRLQVIETIVAVLTPEQRGKFAEHLKEHVGEIAAGG